MKFTETKLAGAFIIDPELHKDDRGFFARSFCQQEFEAYGLNTLIAQCNVSFNQHRGTLRGMHYQQPPYAETKLVRCTMGSIFDVIVDLRPESSTFKQWLGIELTAVSRRMLYIPEGFAHGFQSLENNTEVFYQMGTFYHPESTSAVRWNDPAFGIEWPQPVTHISEKDRSYLDFKG